MEINTVLHTKNGRIIGNAIVIADDGYEYTVKTDYGNELKFNLNRINELFYIADYKGDESGHKNAV